MPDCGRKAQLTSDILVMGRRVEILVHLQVLCITLLYKSTFTYLLTYLYIWSAIPSSDKNQGINWTVLRVSTPQCANSNSAVLHNVRT